MKSMAQTVGKPRFRPEIAQTRRKTIRQRCLGAFGQPRNHSFPAGKLTLFMYILHTPVTTVGGLLI